MSHEMGFSSGTSKSIVWENIFHRVCEKGSKAQLHGAEGKKGRRRICMLAQLKLLFFFPYSSTPPVPAKSLRMYIATPKKASQSSDSARAAAFSSAYEPRVKKKEKKELQSATSVAASILLLFLLQHQNLIPSSLSSLQKNTFRPRAKNEEDSRRKKDK